MIDYTHIISSIFCTIHLMLLTVVVTSQSSYGMESRATLIKEEVFTFTQTEKNDGEMPNTSPSSSSGITHTSMMHEGEVYASVRSSENTSCYPSEQDHQNWFRLLTIVMEHRKGIEEVTTLLNEGKSKGYIDRPILYGSDAYTPIHRAAQDGDLEVVKTLSSSEYNASLGKAVGKYRQTPLHLAAAEGRIDVVKYLLSENPELIHARDAEGEGVLQYTAAGTYAENNVEVMKYLVAHHSANLDETVGTMNLLHFAIVAGNLDMVEYLLMKNYPLVKKEVDGMSPFDYALSQNKEVIAAKISCFMAAQTTAR